GVKLSKARKNAEFTQEQLAWKAGIADNQVGRIERGEISASLKTIFKICKALSIDIKELF
ncbi:MAG: helix-turn-helix protein, partial [Bacteroidota bacterium]